MFQIMVSDCSYFTPIVFTQGQIIDFTGSFLNLREVVNLSSRTKHINYYSNPVMIAILQTPP